MEEVCTKIAFGNDTELHLKLYLGVLFIFIACVIEFVFEFLESFKVILTKVIFYI